MRFEKFDVLVAQSRAVFDGVHAAFKRNLHAQRAFDVRRHLETELVRFVAAGGNDFGTHSQNARFALFFGVQNAAGYHKLDKVGFGLGNLSDVISAVFGILGLVCEKPRHVAALDGHGHVGRYDARSCKLAFFGCVADFAVDVVQTADGSNGGYARHKVDFCVGRAKLIDDIFSERIAHKLTDGFLFCFLVSFGMPEPGR